MKHTEKYRHYEGEYISYFKKVEMGLEDKMSNFTLCGELFPLKMQFKHTKNKDKVTCPKCLALLKNREEKENKLKVTVLRKGKLPEEEVSKKLRQHRNEWLY